MFTGAKIYFRHLINRIFLSILLVSVGFTPVPLLAASQTDLEHRKQLLKDMQQILAGRLASDTTASLGHPLAYSTGLAAWLSSLPKSVIRAEFGPETRTYVLALAGATEPRRKTL